MGEVPGDQSDGGLSPVVVVISGGFWAHHRKGGSPVRSGVAHTHSLVSGHVSVSLLHLEPLSEALGFCPQDESPLHITAQGVCAPPLPSEPLEVLPSLLRVPCSWEKSSRHVPCPPTTVHTPSLFPDAPLCILAIRQTPFTFFSSRLGHVGEPCLVSRAEFTPLSPGQSCDTP